MSQTHTNSLVWDFCCSIVRTTAYKYNSSYPPNSRYFNEVLLSFSSILIVTIQESIVVTYFDSIDINNNFTNFNIYSFNDWYIKIICQLISFRTLFLILWTDMHFYCYLFVFINLFIYRFEFRYSEV